MSQGRRIGAAAVLLAAGTALSRVLGYLREAFLAAEVGVSPAMDAYRAAFLLPDVLNHLLAGGALSVAFIPIYTRIREERGEPAAEVLLATVLGTLGLLSVAFTALLWAAPGPLIRFLFSDFEPGTRDLTVRLTRIVLPAQVFFVVGGILRGALMAQGRFGAQAVAGALYNVGIIAGGLLGGGSVEGFAWGALAGAAIGPFGIALADAMRALRVRLRVAFTDPDFLRYLVVALPLMIGASLLTVDEWYEKIFGDEAGEGVIASLGYARQLMLVPVAVVGQAIAAAALPFLARLHGEGRREELDRTLLLTLQTALGLALLVGAGLFAAARPLVEALYHRGAFTADDVATVSHLLRILCFAVPGWVIQQVAPRAFYARGDTWRPMLLSTGMAAAALPLYWALGRSHGAAGLAAAGALAITLSGIATLLLARRLHGAPSLRAVSSTGLRALAISVPAAAAAGWVQLQQGGLLGATTDLVLAGVAFGVVSLLGLRLVGDAVLQDLPTRLLRPLNRRFRPR